MVGFGGVEIEDAALKGRQYKSVREKRTGLKDPPLQKKENERGRTEVLALHGNSQRQILRFVLDENVRCLDRG